MTGQVLLRIRFCETAQPYSSRSAKMWSPHYGSCALPFPLAFTQSFGPLSNQSMSLKKQKINAGKEKKK